MADVRAVCVFCGSSGGSDPAFAACARAVGRLLAEQGLMLVYGGGAAGLMGSLADAALDAGGDVVGVIPRGLFGREIAHPRLTTRIDVASMHERKQKMFELADAFVALPGGLGTLEELTEMATWAQLGLHDKPIVTVDVLGYWEPFHAFLRSAASSGFVKDDNLALIANIAGPGDLIAALRSAAHPRRQQWLDLPET